jgi:hypothetical protein
LIDRNHFSNSVLPEISYERSDEYEKFPKIFRKLIPKTHQKLNEIMDHYLLMMEGIKIKSNHTKILNCIINKDKFNVKCEYCGDYFTVKHNVVRHINKVHLESNFLTNPYKFYDMNCPIGCPYFA